MRKEHEILSDQADLTKKKSNKNFLGENYNGQNLTIIFSRFNSQLDIAEKKFSEQE